MASCPIAQLLRRMHRGDEAAARALWSALAIRMRTYAAAILPPHLRGGSPDVVQSVFCRVLALSSSRIYAIKDGTSFLLLSVRNECISLIRSSRSRDRRQRHRTLPAHIPSVGDAAALHAALETLSRRQREIIVLKHIAGLTFDQIELSTGTNRNTAASIYKSARQRLQQVLSEAHSALVATQFKEPIHG